MRTYVMEYYNKIRNKTDYEYADHPISDKDLIIFNRLRNWRNPNSRYSSYTKMTMYELDGDLDVYNIYVLDSDFWAESGENVIAWVHIPVRRNDNNEPDKWEKLKIPANVWAAADTDENGKEPVYIPTDSKDQKINWDRVYSELLGVVTTRNRSTEVFYDDPEEYLANKGIPVVDFDEVVAGMICDPEWDMDLARRGHFGRQIARCKAYSFPVYEAYVIAREFADDPVPNGYDVEEWTIDISDCGRVEHVYKEWLAEIPREEFEKNGDMSKDELQAYLLKIKEEYDISDLRYSMKEVFDMDDIYDIFDDEEDDEE